ncbi:MAG TPA: GNAT family N-acetyltransferase [Acidimicrobiales bacterium]
MLLRAFVEDDAALVMEAAREADIVRVTSVTAHSSIDDAHAFIDRQLALAIEGHGYSFALCRADEPGRAVGSAALWLKQIDLGRASIGYWVLARFRGAGLAMAALQGVAQFAFEELAIPSLDVFIEPDNAASVHLAARGGFSWQERLAGSEQINEYPVDVDRYSLDRAGWMSR